MRKNIIKILTAVASLSLGLYSVPSSMAQNSESDWYLVDERINYEAPNYISYILFADRNSMSGKETQPTLTISDIELGEKKVDRKFSLHVIDSQMTITINCEKNVYKVDDAVQYDQNHNIIETPHNYTLNQWTEPKTERFKALIPFACSPDEKDYVQPFDATLQPLVGLIGYLNADWSK